MDRRQFTRTLGFGAVGFGCMSSSVTSCFGKKKIKLGGHPWVYAAQLPNHDITPVLETIFREMSEAGLDGIELMHQPLLSARSVEIIHRLSNKYNLPVIGSSYGAPMYDPKKMEEILREVSVLLKNLQYLGGRTLGTSVGNAKQRKTEFQLDVQADLLNEIVSRASAKGIMVNLHNHTYEVEDDMHDLRGTISRIPDIKLGPDMNWLIRAGVDPVAFIERFGEKIVFVHVRDQYENGKWTESVGQGVTDFSSIGEALARKNFDGDVVIELAHEKDFEITQPIGKSLADSRSHLEQTLIGHLLNA